MEEEKRQTISILNNDAKLAEFVRFLSSCGINYLDEISNVLFIAYKSSQNLSNEELKELKNKVANIKSDTLDADKTDMVLPIKQEDVSICCEVNDTVSNKEEESGQPEEYSDDREICKEKEIEENKQVYKDVIEVESSFTGQIIENDSIKSTVVPFDKIKIESLDLTRRTYNCLKANGINYLIEIYRKDNSTTTKGQGAKFYEEIKAIKNKYLSQYVEFTEIVFPEGKREKTQIYNYLLYKLGKEPQSCSLDDVNWIYKHKFQEQLCNTIETIGLEACVAAVENYAYFSNLVQSFNEAFKDTRENLERIMSIKNAVIKIPKERRNKKLIPLIKFYCKYVKKSNKYEQGLLSLCNEQDVIENILSWEKIPDENYQYAIKFVTWLQFDLTELVVEYINKCVSPKKGVLQAIDLRSQGYTLESIAQSKGVTRERIRQLETIALRVSGEIYHEYHILKLLSALNDDDKFITREEMLTEIDERYGLLLFYLLKNTDSEDYYFDKETNIFSINDNESSFNKQDAIYAVNNMDEFIFNEEWDEKITKTAEEINIGKEYVEIVAKNYYKNYGKYRARNKLSLETIYKYVLRKYYPTGMKLFTDETDRFKEHVVECFGDVKLSNKNRPVDALISRIAVLCDRGTYIHPEYIEIDISLVNKIDKYIETMQRTAISYAELFTIFQNELLLNSSVNNRFYLQGVIKYYLKDKYYSIKDLISKDGNVTVCNEIESFVKERQLVNRKELMSEFDGLRESALCQMLSRCENIIGINNAEYIHASILNITEEDYSIAEIIKKNITSVPLSARKLLDILSVEKSDFLERNAIFTHCKLFGIMHYMFKDEFSFSSPYIAQKGQKNITNVGVVLSLLEGSREISIEDLVAICEENKISFQSINNTVSLLSDTFIRTESNLLVSIEDVELDDDDVATILEQVHSIVKGKGYLSLKNLKDYIWFPNIGYEWNPFLLRSILQKYDDEIVMVDYPCYDSYIMATILIDSSFKTDDYFEFVKIITDREESTEPFNTLEEYANWLREEGLIGGEIPSGILNSEWLEVLPDKTIKIKKG